MLTRKPPSLGVVLKLLLGRKMMAVEEKPDSEYGWMGLER